MFPRVLTALVVLVLALLAYIRFAPTNADKWHQPSMLVAPGDYPEVGGFRAERKITTTAAEVLDTITTRALADPRTKIVAGSVESGMVTFESRSRLIGFPDYTTVTVVGDVLSIYGRLRFGRKDFGVNKARILGWIEALGPLTAGP